MWSARMRTTDVVFVAGAVTSIGRAVVRALVRAGHAPILQPTDEELRLTDPAAVERFFAEHRPRHVIVAAGKSGGIGLNQRIPADLMLDNMLTAAHVCGSAARFGVEKLLYLASSCCYPRDCPQPMRVEHLGTGRLEPTSEPYATAKLAGLQLCLALRRQAGANFVAAIPADVFGPDSSFDRESSHVIPSLIVKMHSAKLAGDPEVVLWGTGAPRREFLFADDLGDACVTALNRYEDDQPINLGGGTELSIRDVATAIAEVVGYRGVLSFDASRPDGMPRKLLDSAVLRGLGWTPATAFRDALEVTYRGFLSRSGKESGGSPA
jgi:GDP-L-fucose synthase